MNVVRVVASRMSRGLALALPALVALSCFVPLIGLMLSSAPSWLAAGIVALAATGICSLLLRDHGIGRAVALSTFGVVAGTVAFAGFSRGINALGTSQNPAFNDLANRIITVMPLVLALFALLAFVVGLRALPADRVVLATAWAIAFVTPFALSVPIGALSDQAGNAGMDVLALFVMPFAAFLVWAFLLLGVLFSSRSAATRSEAPGGA